MNYSDSISYLYSLQKHGIKLGLDNPRRLLSLLDNPQDSFKSIHVAGTNGKGSTSAMIASILKTDGYKTGLFTSPHLVSFTERIRVDNIEIKEDEVVELTGGIRTIIQNAELNPTFFEFVTATAFLYFKRKGVEWAVVETGMGGRLDATNIIAPRISVITNISYDHMEFLGNSLKEIAVEKAGIIKDRIPVVSSSQNDEVMEVIAKKASEKKSGLFVYGRDFISHPGSIDMHGIAFDYEGAQRLNNLYVPLCGMHQIENASVAVRAIELLTEEGPISHDSIRAGLANTQWHGRLELLKMDGCSYDILIDGAHNPSASRRLAESLNSYFAPFYEKIILILGIMSDKDIREIMKPLLPVASKVIMTAPDYERAAPPEKLLEIARSFGFSSTTAGSVKGAIDMSVREIADSPATGSRHLIVITGSFYTTGEAKIALGNKGILTSLREYK